MGLTNPIARKVRYPKDPAQWRELPTVTIEDPVQDAVNGPGPEERKHRGRQVYVQAKGAREIDCRKQGKDD